MKATIDIDRYHFRRVLGDLTVIGTWIHIDDQWRQCLAIIRTGEELHEATTPCLITVDQAWLWSEAPGIGDPRRAARIAREMLISLRMDENNINNAIRIASLIHDHLGDLLTIPPYSPVEPAPVIAEVTMRDTDTGKVREVELRDHV